MSRIVIFIISSLLVPLSVMAAPMAFNRNLPKPARPEIPLNPDMDSFKLRALANKQQWENFYLQARAVLDKYYHQTELEDLADDQFFDQLWSLYYMAGAPLLNPDTEERIQWMTMNNSPDFETKKRAIFLIARPYAKLMHKVPIKQRDLDKLSLAWYVSVFRYLRDIYKPDFNQASDLRGQIRRQHRDKIDPELSDGAYFQKESLLSLRNDSIEGFMFLFERFFIDMLLRIYPDEPGAINKQIKLAGYTDRQIPDLLNKSVDRTKKTEFLYKTLKIKPPKPDPVSP